MDTAPSEVTRLPVCNRPRLPAHLLLGFTTDRGMAPKCAILPPDEADFVAGRYFQPVGLSISGRGENRGNAWIYMVLW